eukprot:1869308-Rhodomonas_salina.2
MRKRVNEDRGTEMQKVSSAMSPHAFGAMSCTDIQDCGPSFQSLVLHLCRPGECGQASSAVCLRTWITQMSWLLAAVVLCFALVPSTLVLHIQHAMSGADTGDRAISNMFSYQKAAPWYPEEEYSLKVMTSSTIKQ